MVQSQHIQYPPNPAILQHQPPSGSTPVHRYCQRKWEFSLGEHLIVHNILQGCWNCIKFTALTRKRLDFWTWLGSAMQVFGRVDLGVVNFMREMDPVYDAEHDDEVRQLRKTMRQRWPVIEKHFGWIFGFTVDGVKLSELQPVVEQHSYTITNTQPNAMVSRTTDMRISVAAPPFSRDESLKMELDQLALIMEKNLTDADARAEIALFPNVNRGF
ncbi:hypothetical protein GCG54_00012101 [Colletotrichum gloeosporioides]|uniref:Uncharacterized protein n=1 Tax=Colletotrichum gloeosporioides TaxID=474922 RepID=A0A8H4CII4_COLGL|nr:uncharacterized protein GCG54_00012101 [Colletotrichum gloeosporioides]KAF3804613.1 hypothetical protein GCG54_00012101 [Colletotrichum gloeosporioides]